MYVPRCGRYTSWQAAAGRRNQREARHDRADFGAPAQRRRASVGSAPSESELSSCRRDQFRAALGHQIRSDGRDRVVQRIRRLADSPLEELTPQEQGRLRTYLANLRERIAPRPSPRAVREAIPLWISLRVDVSETMWARLRQLSGQ